MPISARKLAASFWEHYGVHKLDQADEDHHDEHLTDPFQDRRPLSPAPLRTQLHSPTRVNCQTTGALKVTRGIPGEEKESNSIMASSQAATLVTVLHRVRSVEESQNRTTVMINKLRLDVENAASRIHELEFSHKSTLCEMNNLLQRFGEQMAISRRNEQEKVRLTFLHLREEMEEERNTCRLLQMENKKLSEDLTHANGVAADACEELSKERKARELLEEVCNELAREIGEDKAEVEQLKQEQEESRERLENELKLMRMAALWREEKVRNKLEEAKLELEFNGKQRMPLHELRGKLVASDTIAVVGASSGFQGEIDNQAGQDKFLTPSVERVEHEKSSGIEHGVNDIRSTAHRASVPAWLDAHFSKDRGSKIDNQLYDDGSTHPHMETINGLERRACINGTRKHRKLRRRLRTSGQQVQMVGVGEPQAKACDAKRSGFWEAYCGNLACPSSDDEADRRHSIALQNCTPRKKGMVLKSDPNNCDNSILVVEDSIDMTQATQARKPSIFSSSSKHEMGSPCQESLLIDASCTRSPKKPSSSARFEVGKLGCKSEAESGPRIQHSFSEDDASTYIANRTERGRKQDGELSPCLQIKGEKDPSGHTGARNDNGMILKGTGEDEMGSGDDSELDDFYFEPVRGPTDAYHNKANNIETGDEGGSSKARPERGFGNCGDDACCGVITKCSQVCKELKADEKAGCITVLASPDADGNTISGGQETLNKMSPWRSATGKPLQCLWPPSPDAFSIFGGSKRRGKAASSSSVNVDDEGGLHSHTRRHTSPAKQAVHQLPVGSQKPDPLCMRSNSLGAQLIKARVCDSEKPLKTSFRFSPLRRAASHG